VTGFDSRHSHQSAGREEFRIQGSGVRSREGEGSLQTGAASAVRPIPANANLGGRAVVPAGAGRGLYIGVAAWAITTRYSLPATFQTPLAWRRCRFGIFAAHMPARRAFPGAFKAPLLPPIFVAAEAYQGGGGYACGEQWLALCAPWSAPCGAPRCALCSDLVRNAGQPSPGAFRAPLLPSNVLPEPAVLRAGIQRGATGVEPAGLSSAGTAPGAPS
jgi:hypothetical protein